VAVVSFRSKYIVVAVIAAVVVSLAVGSVLVLENRAQHAALLNSASADSRDRILRELTLRSGELARRVAERVDDAVLLSNHDEISAQLEDLMRDARLLGVVVRDSGGHELYAWRRPGIVAGGMVRSATSPVRASVQTLPGIATPQTVGEVEVEIRSLEPAPDSPESLLRFDKLEVSQIRQALIVAGALGGVVLLVGFMLAWWAGRRMHQPITPLI
jgi:hypothetical protein